jgi:hypothetical protein
VAGDWIKMRGNLWDDPRVSKLVDLTGSSEAAVIGALYWLWSTADQHTEDGCMPGLTKRQIDRKTGVPGFADALEEVGWLADDPQGVVILKFEEHNGTSAKRRCMDAQRKASGRSMSASDADKDRTDDGQKASKLGAREEKRREEKEIPPPTPQGGEHVLPGFTTFWQAWPSNDRKQAKGKCLEAWKKAGAEPQAALVLAHVERMKASPLWTKEDGQFVPAPLVYLNQRRWEGADDAANDHGQQRGFV